jgi:hypothetical protein
MNQAPRIGLASLLALAGVVLLGASQALAAEKTVLCKTNQVPCVVENQYPGGTEFKSTATNTQLTTAQGNITCASSKITNKTTSTANNPIFGKITELVFATCTWKGMVCSVSAINLAWVSAIEREATPDGKLTFAGITGEPKLAFSCGVGTFKCTYGKHSGNFAFHGGEPAEMIPSVGLGLLEKEGIVECPPTIKWNANYGATSPTAVYVTKD